uniref:sodium channel protein type 3 subunit alpha-like isoform X4 n=1 Tax=Styela clava TaxID=7725 RepID=UPI00193ACFC0|nr:sodium channel protein type 3 subunit alpha-like isoform X4 [Styela clava]XP_039264941.1 sodium channel protein type 3 subunit alpha-like isoform X4 [Styela clava]XP_039264942.1 sodium channel protein type 3 subunit alpha-like isoform X4 [Styela clava]XP_039264944.1 sodium channel protein type 3 subunit alpha-like isoform X4 [Styela clava]XP_039264945.1 sodium channel protein type 3 subunit alpha-like isoform X4 [Styela clava]
MTGFVTWSSESWCKFLVIGTILCLKSLGIDWKRVLHQVFGKHIVKAFHRFFFNRKGDPVAEQRRLLQDRVRIERRLAEIDSAKREENVRLNLSRLATKKRLQSSVQYLPTPSQAIEGVRHVSWSDGYSSQKPTNDFKEDGEEDFIMPPRLNLATKRRNAMGHKAHRKSLMQGILSVASGDGKTPTSELKEGKKLPDYLTKDLENETYRSPACAYTALPDPDKYYEKGTYIVVNQQETTFRFSESKSLFIFDRTSKIRQFCINLFIRPLFSHFIMMVILANCVCMMLAEPPPWIEDYLEHVFTAIYCFEAAIKIIGRGFILHRFAYLRDPWNWLDFIVIVFALITALLKDLVGQFSVLRAFRVLRALKTMSVVPGLRGIVKALLRSIRALQDAVVLTIFCVSVFALVGYQLFSGTLRNKCVLIPGSLSVGPDAMYVVDLNMAPKHEDYFSVAASTDYSSSTFKNDSNFTHTLVKQSYNSPGVSPFALIPLYNTSRVEGETIYEGITNFVETLHWNSEDANLTSTILDRLNETLAEKYRGYLSTKKNNINKTRDSNATTMKKNEYKESCDTVFQHCLAYEQIKIRTTSQCSILNMAIHMSHRDSIIKSNCEYIDSVSNGVKFYVPSAEIMLNSTTFTHARPATTRNSMHAVSVSCNTSFEVLAGNISCMYEAIRSRRSSNSSVDFSNHSCYHNNTWLKIIAYGKTNIPRWRARKSVVLFRLSKVSSTDRSNATDTKSLDPIKFFNKEKGFLIFGEYTREELSTEVEKEWDCNENNYILRSVDSGMYFYQNSSNRPNREPLYCTSGENSVCPIAYECKQAGGNPDFGYTNFDHFFWAFLTSFRLIAQDAWSRLFYLTLHTIGKSYVVFYIIVMFLGSYYLINLILAVVYMAYEEQQAVVEDEELEEEEHKAEIRELEASSDDNSSRTQDDESGSRCDSVRSGCVSEGTRRFGLITTSLTSINDAGGIRIRHRSSKRSRYGHRRTPVRLDQESEQLYRQHTKKYGDGLFKEHSDMTSGRDHRTCRTKQPNRQDSFTSEASFVLNSEKTTCSNPSRQIEMPAFRNRCSYIRGCRGSHNVDRKLGSTENFISVKKKEEQPVSLFVTPVHEPKYAENTPDPVDMKLRNTKLDVINVNFEMGRSSSIYSSGSDISSKTDEAVMLPPLSFCEHCRRNRISPRSRTVSENLPTTLLDPPALRGNQDCMKSNDEIPCFLQVATDCTSRFSGSTSSTSGLFEATERVVQAEISPTCHWLSPPAPARCLKKTNRLTSSSSSPSSSTIISNNKKFSEDGSRESASNTNKSDNDSCIPLQVPSLLVTSASSEHISTMSGVLDSIKLYDQSCENGGKLESDGEIALARHSLPGAVDKPELKSNDKEYGPVTSLNDIDRMHTSAFKTLQKRATQKKTAYAEDQTLHNYKRRSRATYPRSSLDKPDSSSAVDIGTFAIQHKGQCNRQIHGQYDLPDTIAPYRNLTANDDIADFEVPLVNGRQGNVPLASVDSNETNGNRTRKKPLKRVIRHYLLSAKRSWIDVFCMWTCCSPRWVKFQSFVRGLVLDPFMDLFITLCIFLNTVFMMAEYHPMPKSHENLLENANLAFTVVFTLEMFLKVVGLGPHTYFREAWNMFDAVVVISSLLEIVLKTIPGLSVLRTFRLMRILKLAKSWPTLNKLLRIIGRTLGKLWHLTIVFLLVLFIFAVVGMQLLREKYKTEFGDNMPRWNFDNFPHAFMVVFRIQCGEWIENMFTCMNVASPGICIPLFILVLVIGNLVILNLFLALLLNSFSGDALQRTDAEPNSLAEAWQRILGWIGKGRRALRHCNIVTHCCNKIRLQLCMGQQTARTNKKCEVVKKKKREQEYRSNLGMNLSSNRTATLSECEPHMPEIKNNCLNSVTAPSIILGKVNLSELKKDSCHSSMSMRGDKTDETGILCDNSDSEKYKTEELIKTLNDGDDQNHDKHHSHSFHRHSINSRGASGTIKRRRRDLTSSNMKIRCDGCHREYSAVRIRPDKRNREKVGFAPAAAFQNRVDSPSPPETRSNRDDDIELPRLPRHPFKASIEYTRTSHEDRIRPNEENVANDKSSSVENRSRCQSGQSENEQSPIPDPVRVENVAGVARKYSGAEETDVLICGYKSVPSTSVKQNSTRSSHKSSSSVRSRRSKDKRGFEEGDKKLEEAETPKEIEIQQCFPPFWINKTDGKFWKIRLVFYNIAVHRYFENMVIFFIMLSSVALAFEDIYLPNKPAMARVLDVLDKFFCIFFTIEMLIKWTGFGIKYYITNGWCILDLIIVFFSLLDLGLSLNGGASEQLASLRVLRTFRALRPLRALSRFQGMKVVVDALVRAIPSIFHVFLVCIIVWLIFSILGVNLFGGRFGRCVMFTGSSGVILPRPDNSSNNSVFLEISDMCLPNMTFPLNDSSIPAVRNKVECLECARLMNTSNIQWIVPSINFDNVGQGFLALMQVATFKGWLEIMANAIDIMGIEQQPSYEVSFENYAYFCIFIIFGAFFSLNLFIGVIIDNFNQQKVKCAGGEDGVFLTDEQKRYYNAMKRMAAKAPSKPIPRPNSWFPNKIYDLVTDRKFEIVVMAMILLNMVVMAVEHYDMSQEMSDVLGNFNLFFICIFFVEAVLKLIGLRWYYFTVPWNVFDIIVVVVSIIVKCLFTASALSDAIEKYFVQPTLFRIIRLFRVTRILRLIREAKGIRTLLFALMMSIPALFNIGSLLFLVIFIYAILGMSQFAYVQKIAGVDDLLNFETFPNAFLVLFQVSTSEGWNTFIEPILRDKPPSCDPDIPNRTGNGNCGNATVGVAYFVTYVLITFLIVINMYIAIILENFEVATRESSEPLTADDFEQFFEVWQRYDDRLSQFITFEQLQHFLHHLDFPLRVPFPNKAFIANARMKITPNGRVHCLEVIIALIKKVLGDSPELGTFKKDMMESFMLKCKTKEPLEEGDTIDTMEYIKRRRSAIVIQKAYRKYKCEQPEIDLNRPFALNECQFTDRNSSSPTTSESEETL